MNRFIGAWRLVSFEEETAAGEIVHPYGENPIGLLIYDSSGRMSVQIMRKDREAFPTTEWETTPVEEIKEAVEGFTAFFGSFEVDGANKTVIHHVEGHVLPGSVGKTLRREFEFKGDLLILKPSPNRRVFWERVTT
ncbi:MAG TPA: lipocalin-like domain-containing protein [Blastocatellia bacterium]|nr:lipocalin-like domain-containing protein [Blastocatellia bacterium]